jgi:hypothetical protein
MFVEGAAFVRHEPHDASISRSVRLGVTSGLLGKPELSHQNSGSRFTSRVDTAANSDLTGRAMSGLGASPGHARSPGLLGPVSDAEPRCSRSEQKGSISSRRERIELGIELTPSGSAGAVVRFVAVLVWATGSPSLQ